jgi:hypothetical protein
VCFGSWISYIIWMNLHCSLKTNFQYLLLSITVTNVYYTYHFQMYLNIMLGKKLLKENIISPNLLTWTCNLWSMQSSPIHIQLYPSSYIHMYCKEYPSIYMQYITNILANSKINNMLTYGNCSYDTYTSSVLLAIFS